MSHSYFAVRAANHIATALRQGITLQDIARELGENSVYQPSQCLPKLEPIFNAQSGLEMEVAYKDGVRNAERKLAAAQSEAEDSLTS